MSRCFSITIITIEIKMFSAATNRIIPIVIVLAITVFGFTITRLGMVVSIPILIVIVSLAGDEFSWPGVVAAAVVLTAMSWFIFIWGLKLTIPLWPAFLAT